MKIRILIFSFPATLLLSAIIFYGFSTDNYSTQKEKSSKTELPDNPLDGRIVFEHKGCINCHSIYGYGGKTAQDLGKHNFSGSNFNLISEMWNHSGEMFGQTEVKNSDQQKFTAKEFQELRIFLYYLRYLGGSGDIIAGEKLFSKMRCNDCHSVGKVIPNKIRLDKLWNYGSPLSIAQSMWNHAARMQKMQKTTNLEIPVFKEEEFTDLSSYITSASAYKKEQKNYMTPGNPIAGEKIYSEKGCFYCHDKKHTAPDLSKMNLNKSVIEIAGLMWNHSAGMEQANKKDNIPLPVFKRNEMADLISFLYFNNKSDIDGSVESGKEVIQEKGCINCHYSGNSYDAPDVSAMGPYDSQDKFFSELWNHLPLMKKNIYLKGKSLSKLLPTEIKSLYLYFNSNKG
jgi:cytochrome c2